MTILNADQRKTKQSAVKMTHLSFLAIATLSLSSCMSRPVSVLENAGAVDTLKAPNAYVVPVPEGSQVVNGLLDIYDDAVIEKLVNQALEANLDVQLAQYKFEEAGFLSLEQGGKRYPQLAASFASDRAQGASGKPESTYTPSLDVSWEVDIWGRLGDQADAQAADAELNRQNYLAMRDSIAAQTMQAWFDVVTAQRIVSIEEARLKNLEVSLNHKVNNYKAGLGALDDLELVKRDIAKAKANKSIRTRDQNVSVLTLQVLMGQYPDGTTNLDYVLPALIPPPAPGVPADLLINRPDIQAAWQNVLKADKNVKVAHKDMFPTFNLTGSLGTQASSFSNILSGATIWSLASNMAMPLFNAGQLKNKMYAAHSRAEQAWVEYLKVVLNAFREVEEYLNDETEFAQEEQFQQEAFLYAQRTANIFEERYKKGLVGIVDYLSVQNAVFDTEIDLLNVRKLRLANRAKLALALGKGV